MKTNKAQLYEDLKQRILTMDLAPDEDLDEISISEQYGLSRTPVREIFRRLSGEGYVTIRDNRGARVAPMNYSTLRGFFLVAPLIYTATARIAVHSFKPHQLAELKATQERFRKASETNDPEAMVVENNRFHKIMGEMAANVYLEPSLNRLLIDHARIGHTFYRVRDDAMEERVNLSVVHHDQFIAALEAGDEDAMVRLVDAHWGLSRENMEMFITPEALKETVFDERARQLLQEEAK